MRALTPWTGMTTLRNEMDRLFDQFLEPAWPEMPALGEWKPALDVSEGKEAVIVKAELPGVEQEDISVSFEDGVLTIKGEKQSEKEEKDKRYHRVERSCGAFFRSVRMPVAIEPDKVTASFKDGVVTITLPKAPEAKSTAIPVKAA